MERSPSARKESPEKRRRDSASRSSSRDRGKRRRSRERSKSHDRRRRSNSRSPAFRNFRGNYRGRYNRRSPFRSYNNRFDRRSRSTSRGRYEGRRFDRDRRSKNRSDISTGYVPQNQPANYEYGNYENSQFGSMQMNSQYNNGYEFQNQGLYQQNQQNFSGLSVPVPPGVSDGWVPPTTMQPTESQEDKLKKEAAVAEEKKRQREDLKKQRDQCIARAEKMKREMKDLKKAKEDLIAAHGRRSPSPTTNGFIKENEKLQYQISSKLLEVLKVIDMLTSIIEKNDEEDVKKTKSPDTDSSPERIKNELLESMNKKKQEQESKSKKCNYIFFDDELHWCKTCQVFPKTVKDYLLHLHSPQHLEKITRQPEKAPWRAQFEKFNEIPSHPDAPTKRTAIKGLQFFEPTTAWFCKLCEVFMGDVSCTSIHLKSELHMEKYNKLIDREPKFEEKWHELRKKACDMADGKTVSDNENKKDDKKGKKKKSKRDSRKDKKKRSKKRKRGSSSSGSSDTEASDSSAGSEKSSKRNGSENDTKNSIRVQMRNLPDSNKSKNNELGGKWTKVSDKPVPPPAPIISHRALADKKEEKTLGQWNMIEPRDDKKMFDKGRMKNHSGSLREKSRSLSRGRERNYRNRRSRTRTRSRSRGRYQRKSRSRSRRRDSRSRSGSRGFRRDRPRINFPPEPKLMLLKDEKKLPSRSYTVTAKKDDPTVKKVMPMIGKMPVFKKQLSEKKPEEDTEKKEEIAVDEKVQETKVRDDTWDDYMPDPMQYSAIMGAPPPPPIILEPEMEAPPGLDPEHDSEFIPKPISDAPIPMKGPLPKDLQETLDLLYDGDKPKQIVHEVKEIAPPVAVEVATMNYIDPDVPTMMTAEEMSQHALMYGGFMVQNADGSNPNEAMKSDPSEVVGKNSGLKGNEANSIDINEGGVKEDSEDRADMDELAMLGIDVNDVGSGFW